MKDSNIRQVTYEAVEVQEPPTKSGPTEVNGGQASDIEVRNDVAEEAFEEAVIVPDPCLGVPKWVVSDVAFELLSYAKDCGSVG